MSNDEFCEGGFARSWNARYADYETRLGGCASRRLDIRLGTPKPFSILTFGSFPQDIQPALLPLHPFSGALSQTRCPGNLYGTLYVGGFERLSAG